VSEQLFARLSKFDLFATEMLQLINHAPTSMGELECLIEDCNSRFTEVQQTEILDAVGEILKRKTK
jgi:hypothetical protein